MVKRLLLFSVMSLCLVACSSGDKKPTLVKSKGLPSELLLVVDRGIWNTDVKDTIESILEGDVIGLMQSEAMFRVTRIFSENYERMYSTMHSKLFVHVDPSVGETVVGVNRDVTAYPQIEVTVTSPSLDVLRSYLSRNGQKIQDVIADAQIDMRVKTLEKRYSKKVSDDLNKVMGMTIRMPENMCATKMSKDFLWGGTNLNQKDLNVVVYKYDWNGDDEYDVYRFSDMRDSVMHFNIPGEHPDQWMQTVRESGVPLISGRIRRIEGKDVYEVRGLWEMRNGALGGPFVSLVRVDTTHLKVVVSEGFVYSPSTEKRDLIRQVEAGLRTLH